MLAQHYHGDFGIRINAETKVVSKITDRRTGELAWHRLPELLAKGVVKSHGLTLESYLTFDTKFSE